MYDKCEYYSYTQTHDRLLSIQKVRTTELFRGEMEDKPSKVSPRPSAMNRAYGSFKSFSDFSIKVVVSNGVTLPSQQPTATKPHANAAVLTT